MGGVLWGIGGFVVMEPITYAVHRWIMHGPGLVLHRSHHARSVGRFEANDAFPVVFGSIVGLLMVLGFNVEGWGRLVSIGVGVTMYGVAYAVVHDIYAHGRLPVFRGRGPDSGRPVAGLQTLAEAHRLHHRFGGEPYGMLAPVIPAMLKAKAAQRV